VLVANTYLRELTDPAQRRTFSIIVEPLVGRITNVRNFRRSLSNYSEWQ